MSVNNVQIVGNIFKDSITSEHSRFVSGMTEERSYRPDSWSQSELYDFIGCVTIKGLSFLDIIHNIDCYVVFDGQTTVLELRKMDFRTWWMTARIYPVVSGGWTVELRETETNRTGRLTESVLSFSAVIPSPGGVVRRVTTLLLMTAPWRLCLSCVAARRQPLVFVRWKATALDDWFLASAVYRSRWRWRIKVCFFLQSGLWHCCPSKSFRV